MSFSEVIQSYKFVRKPDILCAQVILSADDLFHISCRFCDITYQDYEKFTIHFYRIHMQNIIAVRNHNKIDNILNDNDFIDNNIETEDLLDNNSTLCLTSTCDDNNVKYDTSDVHSIDNSIEFIQTTNLEEENISEKTINIKLNNFDNKKFQCNLCTTKFWTHEQFSLHQISHNFKTIRSKNSLTTKNKINIKKLRKFDKKSNRFKCSECFSTFWSNEQLKLHQINHNIINNNKLKYRKNSLDELMIEQPIEEFYNKILEKNKSNTKQCDTCGMCFSSVTSLKRHIMKHTGERPYKCEHCSRGFIRRQALILHLGAHSGEKQFKCEQCDKAYYRKDALQHHMKIHSNNAFFCSYCGKKFKINSEKIYHERRHNNINRKRPFKSRKEKKNSTTITSLTANTQIRKDMSEKTNEAKEE